MMAVSELSRLLPFVVRGHNFVPLIYSGIYDLSTDDMFRSALADWHFHDTTCVLVAGQHGEAGNRSSLAQERLQSILDDWWGPCTVYSQVDADSTPQQAAWVADKIEELNLSAIPCGPTPSMGRVPT